MFLPHLFFFTVVTHYPPAIPVVSVKHAFPVKFGRQFDPLHPSTSRCRQPSPSSLLSMHRFLAKCEHADPLARKRSSRGGGICERAGPPSLYPPLLPIHIASVVAAVAAGFTNFHGMRLLLPWMWCHPRGKAHASLVEVRIRQLHD